MDKCRVKINVLKYQHLIVAILKSKIFPFLLIEEKEAHMKLMELLKVKCLGFVLFFFFTTFPSIILERF